MPPPPPPRGDGDASDPVNGTTSHVAAHAGAGGAADADARERTHWSHCRWKRRRWRLHGAAWGGRRRRGQLTQPAPEPVCGLARCPASRPPPGSGGCGASSSSLRRTAAAWVPRTHRQMTPGLFRLAVHGQEAREHVWSRVREGWLATQCTHLFPHLCQLHELLSLFCSLAHGLSGRQGGQEWRHQGRCSMHLLTHRCCCVFSAAPSADLGPH